MSKFDYLIYIGRFQPFHNGHLHVIKKSLEISKNLIIVLGSHNSAPSIRNPFSTYIRRSMIEGSLMDDGLITQLSRISYIPQVDHTYNEDRWIASIQSAVWTIVHNKFTPNPIKIGIVGFNKDHSSYYLKKFPQWEVVEVEPYKLISGTVLSSTLIREYLFQHINNYNDVLKDFVSPSTIETFNSNQKNLITLKEEYDFIKKYKTQWETSPYPVTFVTVDALVAQSGHILLVKRRAAPGKGLLALPGGFLGQNETLLEATLRELKEETKLSVPIPVMMGSIKNQKTFDNPHRSDRGRTITQTTYFHLTDQNELPKVKGSDDAEKAFWMPFSDVVMNRDQFFEDHFSIIENMVGIWPII